MKITHIIKTKSFKSDGRLLKWIDSLKSFNFKSEVLVLEDNNIRGSDMYNDVVVNSMKLRSRKLFSKRKGYVFKIPEYSYSVINYVKKSDASVFIFHDVQHYLTLFYILLLKKRFPNKTFIWDLHELPHTALSKLFFTRYVIKYILENLDLVIYTNKERRKSISEKFPHNEGKYFILNNYPNQEFINLPKTELELDLDNWLKSKPYLLWMGVANKKRNFPSVLDAYKKFKDKFRLVIMGGVDDEIKNLIKNEHLEEYIFSKFVNQESVINYVDHAHFSIVLYRHDSLNNYYCEPNRLYQLLTRGIPVIIGKNPPMNSVVSQTGGGILLPDDGTNVQALENAIEEILNKDNYLKLKSQLKSYNYMKELNWNNQFRNIIPLLTSLTSCK